MSGAISTVITLSSSRWIPDNLNDGNIEYLFYILTIICILSTLLYMYTIKNFRYKEDLEKCSSDFEI